MCDVPSIIIIIIIIERGKIENIGGKMEGWIGTEVVVVESWVVKGDTGPV